MLGGGWAMEDKKGKIGLQIISMAIGYPVQ